MPVNDLSAYAAAESEAVQVSGGSSSSSSPGSSDGSASALDVSPSTMTDGAETSNATPITSPGEGMQEVPLDAPFDDAAEATTRVDAGEGTAPTPDREPIGAPIASSVPADGARGVSPDVVLVIDFGRPMDPETLPRALISDDLPLAGASFAWNGDSSVVRITLAEPLAVASGDDPAELEARCYSYRVSDAALDADGNALLASDVAFCTTRRITQTLGALSDPVLSGSFRSNDSFGDGACGLGANTVCVGDSGFAANSSYRGFLTFDASALPQPMLVVEAELRIETPPDAGTPFADLGELLVEQLRFTRVGREAFGDAEVTPLGVMNRASGADLALLGDMGPLRLDESDRIQLRLRFADDTDQDGLADHIVAQINAVALSVSYDIP